MPRYVKNLNGTSHRRPPDGGTWLDFWRTRTRTRSDRRACAVVSCPQDATVGAHVQEKGIVASNAWLIAPFCRTHNHFSCTEIMEIDGDVYLVPVRELKSDESFGIASLPLPILKEHFPSDSPMITCPHCYSAVPGPNFCGRCGASVISARVNRFCMRCGAETATNALFCGGCGAPTAGPT